MQDNEGQAPSEARSGAATVTRALDPAKTTVEGRDPGSETDGLSPLAPTRIGRYEIRDELGRGGMGVVYRAHDPSLDRPVAIKLVSQHRRAGSDAPERLVREARTLAKLSHANVVAVFETGTFDGQLFIAMELVEGDSLRAWARRSPRSTPQLLGAMIDAGRGLAAAHASGLVHRDFKPDNVMLDRDGRAKVLDFGLARGATATDASDRTDAVSLSGESGLVDDDKLTKTGLAMGTPAYMAPEQFRGSRGDARVDQYAYCVTLFELFAGGRPYRGDTFAELARSAARGEIDPTRMAKIPRSLQRIVRRGLSVDPDARFADMDELLVALQRTRRRRRWPALVGVSALCTAAIAVVATRDPDAVACPETVTNRDAIWSAARAATVRDAIAELDVEYGASVATTLSTAMASYADTWAAARRDACVELQRTEADDPRAEQIGRHIDCLERGRIAAVAALDVMDTIDATTLHRAPRILDDLPAPEACRGSDDASSRPVTPTPDAGELASVRATASLGRYEAGLQQLLQLRERRDTTPDAWVAEVEQLHGRLLTGAGRAVAGADAMAAAYFAASDAGRFDLACRAASAIAGQPAVGYQTRWRWARHAEAALQRHGKDDALLVDYESAMCRLQRDSGDLDDAVARCERVLSLVKRAAQPEAEAMVTALRGLAAAATAADDQMRAHALSSEALRVAEAVAGDFHPLVADAATDFGRAALALTRPDEALALGQRALEIRERALGAEHPDVAHALDLLTDVRRSQADGAAALELAERGRVLRAQAYGETHPLVAKSLYARALAEEQLGRFDAALRSMQRVSEIDEQLHPLNIDRLPTLREQARMAFSFGEGPKRGRVHLERAWEIVEQSAIPKDHPLVRDLNHGYGETLLELGEATAALPYLEAFVSDPRPHHNLPHLQFVLARALYVSGTDRPRALELVATAREAWQGSDVPFRSKEVAAMDQWLAQLPP